MDCLEYKQITVRRRSYIRDTSVPETIKTSDNIGTQDFVTDRVSTVSHSILYYSDCITLTPFLHSYEVKKFP